MPPPYPPLDLSSSDSDQVDPSIVLAAGQRSRLRRRPAIHLRNARNHQQNESHSQVLTTLYCGGADSDSDYDSSGALDDSYDAHRPGRPQILPVEPSPPPNSHLNGNGKRPRHRRTNGCGTRVHGGASPMNAHGFGARTGWRGGRDCVESVVVPLERRYISREARMELRMREDPYLSVGCGCTVEGMGCAVW
jgi:hypothetical protein